MEPITARLPLSLPVLLALILAAAASLGKTPAVAEGVIAVGSNGYGQCDVSGWSWVTAISAGSGHTVGLTEDGSVIAAGDNGDGQCNTWDWEGIVAIAAGGWHTVGLCSDGTAVAVGWNDAGQCDVSDGSGLVAIAAGGYHTVGLRSDGTVVATGLSYDGRCDVSGWSGMTAVAAGAAHTVGLRSDGTVAAVGDNSQGQCAVSGWSGITAIAAGAYHTVGLRSDGTVVAAGRNGEGQCAVSGWSGITAIAAGGWHTVGLSSDHTVLAVGWDLLGQCGVSGWSGITAIAAGGYHTVALKAPPVRLGFRAQPANAVALQPLPAVQVAVQDAFGGTVESTTRTVTVALGANPGGGALTGTRTVATVNGVATFADLKVSKPGSGYTLVATSSGLESATSAVFNITLAPVRLAFTVPPAGATAGAALAPVQVTIRDSAGNLAPTASHPVTLVIAAGPAGGTLSGSTTVVATAGVATFADLTCNKAGTYYLRASAPGLSGATSGAFAITAGPVAQIAFTRQPATTMAGAGIGVVQVTLRDAQGNVCATATDAVTVALGANPTGAALGGTRTVAAVRGVASFTHLRLDKAGDGYALRPSAAGVTGANSASFDITPAAPARLSFVEEPTGATAGAILAPPAKVAVLDRFENRCTGVATAVEIRMGCGDAAALSGTRIRHATAGVASFGDLSISRAGRYFLLAVADGIVGAVTQKFTIAPGPATAVVFTRQPNTTVAGQTMGAVQVMLMDALGNRCTAATDAVTLALGANPTGAALGGTKTMAAVRGIATFSSLRLLTAGVGYTLRAGAAGIAPADSAPFDITATTPVRLVFTVQPSGAAAGAILAPSVKASLLDRFGNVCTGATKAVTVALPSGYAGTLAGTRTQNAVAGAATFDDLVVYRSGGGSGTYRLAVSASGLTGTTSSAFVVTGSAAPPEP